MLDAVGAVLLIEMKNHLDVRGRAEPVASGYQFLAKLRAIIDFAVADELDRLILVGKRLCPAGEIDDAQSTVAEGNALIVEIAMAIRPPMHERLRSEEHTSELQSLMRTSYAV